MMFPMTYGQQQLVYNFTSFTLACMMACTIFFWLRLSDIGKNYRTAMAITGLVHIFSHTVPVATSFLLRLPHQHARLQVTFIAFYHYIRIFNSWVDAYQFPKVAGGANTPPTLTGVPFNDAYRYMDWLLTVPLLLMELVLVMKFEGSAADQVPTHKHPHTRACIDAHSYAYRRKSSSRSLLSSALLPRS